MKFNHNLLIDKYYPVGLPLRDIYFRHCRSVADFALSINQSCRLCVDNEDVDAAAMLHDIGIFLTDAPGIECRGTNPYILHGILGAELLRREGAPESYALVAERHTGAGLSVSDIRNQNLPLPRRDFIPQSKLERLICFADKFYSKSGDMKRKSLETVRHSMQLHGAESYQRWLCLEKEFLG